MSHFMVLVVGNEVDLQLAPFQEGGEDLPKEYLEFEDIEEEYLEQYLNDSVEKVVMPDGRLLNTWDREFKSKTPDHLERREIKFTELYPTFEEYMEEWCGFEERNKEFGKFGYWHNPNAKWDWYSIGGRWSGWLKLKNQHDPYMIGESGVFGNKCKEGHCDVTQKKYVDFEEMCSELKEKAKERWEIYHNTYMKLFKEGQEGNEKSKNEATKLAFDLGLMWEQKELSTMSLKEYVECAGTPTPYALLWDGKWYSEGDMGWFGFSFNYEPQWTGSFRKLWDEIPDDETVTVVDCHI